MSDTIEPKKCPCCGDDDRGSAEPVYDEVDGLWQVSCECGLSGPATLSEKGAVAQWNMIAMFGRGWIHDEGCPTIDASGGCKCEQLYYVQDNRNVVGNCLSWWGIDHKGYTCELNCAGKYTAAQIARMRPDVDVPWPVEYVDAHAIRHFRTDMTGIERPAGTLDAGKRIAKRDPAWGRVTVCDQCLCAACWNGTVMCGSAKTAGTVEKSIRELMALNLEHPSHWGTDN